MAKKKKSLKQKKHELKKQDNVIPISDFLLEEEEEFDLSEALSQIKEYEDNMDPIILNRIQSAFPELDFSETEEEKALYRAMDEENEKKHRKLLEQFVKNYPENLDGRFQLLLLDTEDLMEIDSLQDLEEIYRLALKEWKKLSYASYFDLDVRLSLTVLSYVMDSYFNLSLLEKAKQIADLIRSKISIEERFPPGFIYTMLSIYNKLYRQADVESFYNLAFRSGWEDDGILVHAVLAKVLSGDFEAAERLMRKLVVLNRATLDVFNSEYWPERLDLVDRLSVYAPCSYFSILVALRDLQEFLISTPFIAKQMVKLVEIVEDELPDSRRKRREFIESNCMQNVQIDKVNILIKEGILSQETLETYTEKEILAISGIGPKTIKQLKENGVNFRE